MCCFKRTASFTFIYISKDWFSYLPIAYGKVINSLHDEVPNKTEYFFRSSKRIYALFAHLFHQNMLCVFLSLCIGYLLDLGFDGTRLSKRIFWDRAITSFTVAIEYISNGVYVSFYPHVVRNLYCNTHRNSESSDNLFIKIPIQYSHKAPDMYP